MAIIIDVIYSEFPSNIDRDNMSPFTKRMEAEIANEGTNNPVPYYAYNATPGIVFAPDQTTGINLTFPSAGSPNVASNGVPQDNTSSSNSKYQYWYPNADDAPRKAYMRKIIYGIYKIKHLQHTDPIPDAEMYEDKTTGATFEIDPFAPDFKPTQEMYVKIITQVKKQSGLAVQGGQDAYGAWVTQGVEKYFKFIEYPRMTAPVYNRQIRNYIGTERIKEDELLNGHKVIINGKPEWVGTAILDKLTAYINDNLAIQHDTDRIKGDQYATAYVTCMQMIVQAAVQYVLGRRQSETATEKTLAATELQQRQALGFDDNNMLKMLGEISHLFTVVTGADLDIPGMRVANPGAVDAVFRDAARYMGLPDSLIRGSATNDRQ